MFNCESHCIILFIIERTINTKQYFSTISSLKMNDDTVGLTSRTSAAARAHESKRPNALFKDEFSPIYASQTSDVSDVNRVQIGDNAGRGNDEQTHSPRRTSRKTKIMNKVLRSPRLPNSRVVRIVSTKIMRTYQDIAVRTCFLDDIILQNFPNVTQIVLLACGGDFRPYRLRCVRSLLGLTFYLLDVPHVLRHRQYCLAQLDKPATSPYKVVEVPCDLANAEWVGKLREAGFARDQSTLWIAEGFLQYLNEQQIALLFNQIQKLTSSEHSSIAFDLASRRFQTLVRYIVPAGLIHFAVDNTSDVSRIFSKLGCYDIECTSFEELGRIYDRHVSHDRSFIVQAKINPLGT